MSNMDTLKNNSFVLHGDICFSGSRESLITMAGGYLICEEGVSKGVYASLPEQYENLPLIGHEGKLILPGLVDLHMHAPQFSFRSLGMDCELLEWLEAYAFPEEAKYSDLEYARTAYGMLVRHLAQGPNSRVCLFATLHVPATMLLMDLLEESGLAGMVGKVNMDRNCSRILCEDSAGHSREATFNWLAASAERYKNVKPIITPRFIPACSDELMDMLAGLQKEFKTPVQSHLSESLAEVEWVRQLCPSCKTYADAYMDHGLFGGGVPTIMAHCVWPDDREMELLKNRDVYVAHCPQSNMNLISGIAPVRRYINNDINVGLGSDVAGGCHTSIFRAMAEAIQVSKLRSRYVDRNDPPLTVKEVFYLGTAGGGSFFGKVGSFESGYELDAIIIDDSDILPPFPLTIEERLTRVIYLSDNNRVFEKYVRGQKIISPAD